MQTRLPFTCPDCRTTEDQIETPLLPPGVTCPPAAGARCERCYMRMKVLELSERGMRALYVARLPKHR